MPTTIDLRSRFLGCLLGGAVADALGAPFEGLWSHSIPDEPALLADFGEFEVVALISTLSTVRMTENALSHSRNAWEIHRT